MDIKAFCTAHSMDLGQAAVSLQGGSFSLVELKTSPVAFLLLAEDDYERGGLSALINATTFGFGSFRWDVPRKVEKLLAMGLLAPTLLRKIVKMRNTLEHTYQAPSLLDVEEAMDVAALFVMSATALFIPFEDELQFSLYDRVDSEIPARYILVGLNTEEGAVFYTAYAYETASPRDVCIGECKIQSGHALFDSMVKLSASLMLRYKVDQALKGFEETYAALK
jgi:hypothetical protein